MRSFKILFLAIIVTACGTDLPVSAPTGTITNADAADVSSTAADTATGSDVHSADTSSSDAGSDVGSKDAGSADILPVCVPTEVCDNNLDENCDGQTDEEGCECSVGKRTVLFVDADDDGFGTNETKSFCITEVTPSGYATKSGDCRDFDPLVNPSKAEKCNDIDDDCNGLTDEDFLLLGKACGEGVCAGGTMVCSSNQLSAVCSTSDKALEEKCDGIDDNCDGVTDNNPKCNNTVFGGCYKVHSAELGQVCSGLYGVCMANGVKECGWEVNNTVGVICSTDVNGSASKMVDEVCGDKLDNDCDGVTDNGCDPSDLDQDGDGFKGLVDCNDNDATVFPGTPYCPTINGLTQTSYMLVVAYEGPKATSGFADTFNWELGGSADNLEILDNQKAFVPGTYFALDLYNYQTLVDYKFVGFNVHSFDGSVFSWDACGIDKQTGEYTVKLPKVYVIKYGVWKDVTATAMPKSSASQDPALKCYAAIAL